MQSRHKLFLRMRFGFGAAVDLSGLSKSACSLKPIGIESPRVEPDHQGWDLRFVCHFHGVIVTGVDWNGIR